MRLGNNRLKEKKVLIKKLLLKKTIIFKVKKNQKLIKIIKQIPYSPKLRPL